MILDEDLYDRSKVYALIPCRCDYCDVEFERSKRNIKVGRTIICKESCNSKECSKKKRQESQLVKYGVSNAGGTQASQAKAKQTFLANYGVDNPMQCEEVKEKAKQTCLSNFGETTYLKTDQCRSELKEAARKNYGYQMIDIEYNEVAYEDISLRTEVCLICDYCGARFSRVKKSRERNNKNIDKDSCGSKDCARKKKEEVNLKLYGHVNYFQSQDAQSKIAKTNLEKFGSETYLKTDDFKEKRKAKLIESYGVEVPLQSKEILQKQQSTCLERYGVENYAQSEEFDAKRKKSVSVKYGVDSVMKMKTVLTKRDSTNLEKYGVVNYAQTAEFKVKYKSTCVSRFGVDHPSLLKTNRKAAEQTCIEKYGVGNYAQTEECKFKYKSVCMDRYQLPTTLLLNRKFGKQQAEIAKWLNSFGFNFASDYKILDGKELDLYDSNLNIAIEYCGLFWHTELSPQPRERSYHYSKYKRCQDVGVRLFTIFSDEWKLKQNVCESILKSALGLGTKIYARKCNLKEISKSEFRQFCEHHHLLGSNSLALICYGLYFEDELVAGMSLGRHHRNNPGLVLDRLCFAKNVQVIGGSSRLFKACTNWAVDNGYGSIVSWSDNRWSSGDVYKVLGFNLESELGPDYSYVNLKKPTARISKQSQMKSLTNCPSEISEREWAAQRNLARIWDCGKKRWKIVL